MAKLSAGQKRRQKALKRRKKKAAQHVSHSKVVEEFLPDLPKLSDRIIELAGPLLEGAHGDKGYIENAIGMVVMCWNVGTVKEDVALKMREDMNRMLAEGLHNKLPEDIEQQLDLFITARRGFYKDDPRFIMHYEVSWDLVGDYNLQVGSTPLSQEERFSFSRGHPEAGLSQKISQNIIGLKSPPTEQQEPIVELVEQGYSFLGDKLKDNPDAYAKACDLWLSAWSMVKVLYQDETSIDEIKPFAGVMLSRLCSDLEMQLLNAGLETPDYFEKRIHFCRDFCECFPDSSDQALQNMRRAEAGSLFLTDRREAGEAAFEALVRDFPDDAWSYICWGDMYSGEYRQLPVDKEKAEKLYRTPIDRQLEYAEDAQERLDELLV